MRLLLAYAALLGLTLAGRIKRQNTVVEITCSACEKRIEENQPQMCCRCQDQRSLCNNDFGGDNEFRGDNGRNPEFGGEEEETQGEDFGNTQGPNQDRETNTDCDALFENCPEETEVEVLKLKNTDCDELFEGCPKEAPVDVLEPGLTCSRNLDCQNFGDCSKEESSCSVGSLEFFDLRMVDGIDLRQSTRTCPRGQVLCCNPVPGDLFAVRLGIVTENNPLGDPNDIAFRPEGVCSDPRLAASTNFEFGVTCGKRDSRVYYDAVKSEAEGGSGEESNPGEWPWTVLLFSGDEYVGAGTLMDNDVVVTTATKVRGFVERPETLSVKMGDWDPKVQGPNSREDFPHVTLPAACIRLHPEFDDRSLAYNVAVITLDGLREPRVLPPRTPEEESVASVVEIRSAPRRPADHPEGVEGSRRNPGREEGVGLRQGGRREQLQMRKQLLAQLTEQVDDGLSDSFLPRSYINTACLPENQAQFVGGAKCWVAAWGNNLREQREVDLPLVGRAECNQLLAPEFRERGVTSWAGISPSELCAGGRGKDACAGEGGAPLVCLDEDRDQFYAVGLVNYGFDCSGDLPAVYVNLADPEVKDFITAAFGGGYCTERQS